MKVLVTGGAGFIGSHFVRYLLSAHPEYTVVNLDALTYAGFPGNLTDVRNHPYYHFVHGDIADRETVTRVVEDGIEAIVNFAAESHVDRSIAEPDVFVRTNVLGVQTLLEAARQHGIQKFVQVSTDEVYGSLGREGLFTEASPLAPNSPYSASKAGGDLMARAYYETYGLPITVTRSSNNYGPHQFPEKLIPLMIINALNDRALPVYGDGLHVRDWLHVEDHCRAIDLVLHGGRDGEVYNIGGNNEVANLDIVKLILKQLGKPESLIQYVKDRPGHDRRYGIDAAKIRTELGWEPRTAFQSGIVQTIEWYATHPEWWQRILSGEYRRGRF